MPVTLPLTPNHPLSAAAPGPAAPRPRGGSSGALLQEGKDGQASGEGQTRGAGWGRRPGPELLHEEELASRCAWTCAGGEAQDWLIRREPGPWAALARLFLVVWQEEVRVETVPLRG